MEPTAIDNHASAPVAAASQTESPDWLETPDDATYKLIMFEDDAEVQGVDMTRGEYIGLKKHLAGLRGLPMPPDDEAETTPPPAAGAKTSVEQIRVGLADDIAGIVKGNAAIGIGGIDQSTILGDLYMLKDIVQIWEGCAPPTDKYLGETPLVAAIREHLGL
jgi:hypothetical protein